MNDKKNNLDWFKKHKYVTYVIAAIILISIGSAIGQSGQKTNLSSTPASTTTTSKPKVTTPKPTAKAATTTTTASTPAKTTTTTSTTTKAATPAKTTTTAPAAPKTLLSLSGNGIENSAPFLVTESQLTVTYSYDCSSQGGDGNFIADLEYGDQSSLNSDDQSIANAESSGATNVTTTIYPQDPGNDYYLAVDSECSWTVTVTT